jgi:hypothetical protein
MLKFDEKGFLTPYNPINVDLENFKRIFVYNERCKRIFNNYLDFNALLLKMPVGHFYQWLNGSFVTSKQFPNDLDFVNFVNFEFYIKFEKEIRILKNRFDKLDCYFVSIYPKEHRFFDRTHLDILEWQHDFSTNRITSIFEEKTNKKGFIQINFE